MLRLVAIAFCLSVSLFLRPSSVQAQGLSALALTADEAAWLEQHHEVRVRVGNHPPWEMAFPKPHGMAVDYLTRLGERYGITFRFISAEEPWADGFADVVGERRRYDLIPAAKHTPEREALVALSMEYLSSPWVIFTRDDAENVFGLGDLEGRIVAVERGYVMQGLLQATFPEIHQRVVDATSEAVTVVASGEADAYVGNLIVTSYLLQTMGVSNLRVASPTPFGDHAQSMAVRKDWAPLASLIDKGIVSMAPDERQVIQNTYLPVRFDQRIDWRQTLNWVLAVSVLFGVVLVLILRWNRKLREQIGLRIAAERRLRTTVEALEDSNRDLQNFAHVISHDLREPLRMVSSYLSLLRRKYGAQLDEDGRSYIGFAVKGAKRMDDFVCDLLEFSRVHSEGSVSGPVDAAAAAAQAVENLKERIGETGGTVRLAGDLPAVLADETQLIRVFQNIIGNGLKYRDPERVPKVVVAARVADGMAIFSVTDNGIGIPSEAYDKVFLMFRRLHDEAGGEGMGAGLAICKRIIERHNGRIWVDSVPGRGSTFFFTLPAAPPAES